MVTEPDLKIPPISFIIPMVAIVWGSAYQIGYFYSIGIEFISLSSPVDWLFSVSVSLVPMYLFLPIIYHSFGVIQNTDSDQPYKESSMYKFASNLYINIIFYSSLVIFIISFAYFEINIFYIYPFIILFMIPFFMEIIHLLLHSILIRDIIFFRAFFSFMFASSIIISYTGFTYAALFAGNKCTFIYGENNTMEAQYLRSVSNGHLLKLGGRTVFLNSDFVQMIRCGDLAGPTPTNQN